MCRCLFIFVAVTFVILLNVFEMSCKVEHILYEKIKEYEGILENRSSDSQQLLKSIPNQFRLSFQTILKQRVDVGGILCQMIASIRAQYDAQNKYVLAEGIRHSVYRQWLEEYGGWNEVLLEVALDELRIAQVSLSHFHCKTTGGNKSLLYYAISRQLRKVTVLLFQHDSTFLSGVAFNDILLAAAIRQDDVLLEVLLSFSVDKCKLKDVLRVVQLQCDILLTCDLLHFIESQIKILKLDCDHVHMVQTANDSTNHLIETVYLNLIKRVRCTVGGKWRIPTDLVLSGFLDIPNKVRTSGWRSGTANKWSCNIPVFQYFELSKELFSSINELSVPILVKRATSKWRLWEDFTRKNLLALNGEIDVMGGSIPYSQVFGERHGYTAIREFLQHMDTHFNQSHGGIPMYVFDPYILNERFSGKYSLPDKLDIWDNEAEIHHQFILGSPGSGAPYHFHCPAFNVVLYGRKRWCLLPPGKAFYSKLHPTIYSSDFCKGKDVIQCVQGPGDMVYVPEGWGHSTVNLDETIGVAMEMDHGHC